MIIIDNLTKVYKTKNKKVIALKNISLKFEYGKIYGIIGVSGSGKSTLLNIIGLLDTATQGIVKIDNNSVNNKTSEKIKEQIRAKKIGFVFQDFYLNNNLTALENVLVPMYLDRNINKNERKERAKNILINLGLENRLNHYPTELSGGEQQRVAIARALANNPKILIADEPTGNLDRKSERKIFENLKKLSKNNNCCVIIATHSEEIKKYVDQIIIIDDGEIIKNEKNKYI